MAMFKAFKPSGMEKIARSMGYQGDMQGFQDYLATNPAQQQQMDLYTGKAMEMAKGGYAKKYNKGGAVPPRRVDIKGQDHMLAYITPEEGELLKAHGGSGKPGPMGIPSFDDGDGFGGMGPTSYFVPTGSATGNEQEYKRIRIGSSQDTVENRMIASSELASIRQDLGPGGIPEAFNRDIHQRQYEKDLAALQGRPDPYAAEEAAAAEQAAAEAQAAADAQAAAQAQAAAEQAAQQQAAAAQQQYSQQVAAQMQNRQTQTSIQPTESTQTAQTTQPIYVPPYVPPIYQAPYLSGTRFTPVGQYVQDPNTGQPVAVAYTPLNQGYAAAANNFYQQIYGGYGTPEIQNTTLTQNKGGYVKPQKFAVGGTVTNPAGTQAGTPVYTGASPTQYNVTPATYYQEGDELPDGVNVGDEKTPEVKNAIPGVAQFSVEQMYNPALPVGGVTIAAQTQTDPRQDIATGTGELTGQVSVPTATASTAQAQGITPTQANVMQAAQAAPGVDSAMNATQAAQANPQDPRAQITAAQQTTSSVGNLTAAQGNAFLINNPVQRQIQAGELISGVANAQTAAQFTEQIQAAQATPSQQATVQGQLNNLMQQFQGGATPPWASGAMLKVSSQMAARGLGASSLAGQALVQAAMESALPIAQADASVFAQFEGQNLSNRQQRAMLAAEQRARFIGQEFDQAFQSRVQNSARIGDIANMNFTAEQQVQLENSRAVNTMNLNNLSNRQAMVMAEAAALAQLDTANLSNRQQSAVQNAQNFLQVDMANLSNRQQTELFKAQQRVQSLFTDQAATNAAAQFNATSQNQVDQFFASLGAQVSQFNATQQNAQAQFNAGQTNTVNRFNAELNNQRDQFNAQNQLVIAQSNAQWRRQIATADTAAVNRANELNANAILDISKNAYDNLWQYYADSMEWAWESSDNELDRQIQLSVAKLQADSNANLENIRKDYESSKSLGSFVTDVLSLGVKTGWSFGF